MHQIFPLYRPKIELQHFRWVSQKLLFHLINLSIDPPSQMGEMLAQHSLARFSFGFLAGLRLQCQITWKLLNVKTVCWSSTCRMLNQHLHQRQQLLQLGWALWLLKWVDWLFELAGTSLMAIQLTRKLTYSMQRFSHINAAPMFPEDILLRRTPAPNRSYVTQDDSWQLKSWCNAAFFIWNFHQLPSDQPSMPLVQMSIRMPDMAMWKSLCSRRCFSSSTVTSVENLFPDSHS